MRVKNWKGLVAEVKLPCLGDVDNWVCPSSVMSQREISGRRRRDLKQPSILIDRGIRGLAQVSMSEPQAGLLAPWQDSSLLAALGQASNIGTKT